MVATAPREKTPHRVSRCEELDPATIFSFVSLAIYIMIQMVTRTMSSLFLCRKLHSFLGKSTKTAAARAALFDSNMHQIVCWLGLCPRPPRCRGEEGRKGEGGSSSFALGKKEKSVSILYAIYALRLVFFHIQDDLKLSSVAITIPNIMVHKCVNLLTDVGRI